MDCLPSDCRHSRGREGGSSLSHTPGMRRWLFPFVHPSFSSVTFVSSVVIVLFYSDTLRLGVRG